MSPDREAALFEYLDRIATALERIDARLDAITVEEVAPAGEEPPQLDAARDPASPLPGFQRWRNRQEGIRNG